MKTDNAIVEGYLSKTAVLRGQLPRRKTEERIGSRVVAHGGAQDQEQSKKPDRRPTRTQARVRTRQGRKTHNSRQQAGHLTTDIKQTSSGVGALSFDRTVLGSAPQGRAF